MELTGDYTQFIRLQSSFWDYFIGPGSRVDPQLFGYLFLTPVGRIDFVTVCFVAWFPVANKCQSSIYTSSLVYNIRKSSD